MRFRMLRQADFNFQSGIDVWREDLTRVRLHGLSSNGETKARAAFFATSGG